MLRQSADKPRISGATFRFFSSYTRMYVRRHFHSLRVVRGSAPNVTKGTPVIVCLNHPSWWDPLVALTLANATFSGRAHYAPIDSNALATYRIFERLGFFGIEPNSLAGAARFLQIGRAILADPRSVLWITAEGAFTDVRTRPVKLRSGVGHLIHSLDTVKIVPLALEYVFWEERAPEALACWGEPISVTGGSLRRPGEWTEAISRELEVALDRLAQLSSTRDKKSFEVVLQGGAGIGGAYDLWRRLRALLHGRRFLRQHGSEEF